jgi:hypothetical protein
MNRMSDKIFQLYLLIMAIPLAIIIEFVSKNPEYNLVLRFSVLLIIVIEWIYCQASFNNKYKYTFNSSRAKSIAAVFFEICICISAAFAAYQIASEKYFYVFAVSFFFFDLITQFLTNPNKHTDIMYKVTLNWIILDLVEFSLFVGALIFAYFDKSMEQCRSTVLVVIVFTLTLANFIQNWDFLFGKEKESAP